MTTKEQERAALDKIEKILKTVDPNGWVATACAGCGDDARNNLDEDAAYSWKDRAESYKKDMDYFHDIANRLDAENERLHETSLSSDIRKGLFKLCHSEKQRIGKQLAALKDAIVRYSVESDREEDRKNAVEAYKDLTEKDHSIDMMLSALLRTLT